MLKYNLRKAINLFKDGDKVTDFSLPDQDKNVITLSEVAKIGPVVLFFYPKAFTPICTKESCAFRDIAADLSEFNVSRLGISSDSTNQLKKFQDEFHLDYPLLSDQDRSVSKLYGVKRPGPLFSKRTTFVISSELIVITQVTSELNVDKHIKAVMASLTKI